MTREEAIERMKTMRWEHATNPCPDRTAFDMAISALSENKEDLINKQEQINQDLVYENDRLLSVIEDIKAEIEKQEFTHHQGLTHWYMTPSEVKSIVFEIIDKHIGKENE